MSENSSAGSDSCRLTPEGLESSLASDHMLCHYLNAFLSLPYFPEAVRYNQASGLFELVSGESQTVCNKIKTALNHLKSALLLGDSSISTRAQLVDNQYNVTSLQQEEGIQWIKRERLPFFLQSDFYHEYRLSKLLLQWNPNLLFYSEGSPCKAIQSPLHCPSQSQEVNQNSEIVQNSSEKPNLVDKGPVKLHHMTDSSLQNKWEPSERGSSSSLSSADLWSSHNLNETYNSDAELQLSFSRLSAIEEQQQEHNISTDQMFDFFEEQPKGLAAKTFKEVLEPATNIITQTQANTSESFTLLGDQINYCCTENPQECQVYQHSEKANRGRLVERNKMYQDVNWASDSAGKTGWDGICYYGDWISLDDFREFLQGTPGEKLVNLWIDIERLKAIQNSDRKSRYLVLMRSWYLSKSGPSNLSGELLSRLGLTTSPCWTEEKLHSVQPYISESLLRYWVPRFCTSPLFQQSYEDIVLLGSPPLTLSSPNDSRTECFHLRPDTCFIQTSHVRSLQIPSSREELRSSSQLEEMLQALCAESCGGSFFTQFCERSGNQLWVNAVYFWADLQHFRALFYQDGLDLYKVQREAQLLYFTYISSCAQRSLNIDEPTQRKVYDQLLPAFEELFDEVEKHALSILLEPWALLINREKESFQQVGVLQEVRCINSQDFRDLQSLYEESLKQQKQVEQSQSVLLPSSTTPTSSSVLHNSWSNVSPDYHGYRLESLLQQDHEIQHFKAFLQKQDASIHLACWLDLEQYKGIPLKDEAIRNERFTSITHKYLNNTYFFGPDSPATAQQQKEIVHLAGGQDHLKMKCLSNPVAMEIRDIVKAYMEKTWLPLFLSTPEFTERQKHKPKQLLAADRPSHYRYFHRRRRRREAWKVEGLWMSSSKEILLFRQALLNPVTCQQFQHFASLKRNFLENDLLFWLEVQRYKDLCHSHSDEATIQKKISTIISCFINSSMPPALQIDIPQQQAQHILEKRYQLGPYIFREAQISVFRELLRLWPEFQKFRSSMEEDQLLPALQEERVKYRDSVRRQRRKEEEKEGEEEEERRVQEHGSGREEDETEEEMEESPEGRGERKQLRTQSRAQPLLWSYSKYMAGLKREEGLQSQLETSSTVSGSSFDCRIKSAFSKSSNQQSSRCSFRPRADSKQRNRPNN